jgi:hypothetical protein
MYNLFLSRATQTHTHRHTHTHTHTNTNTHTHARIAQLLTVKNTFCTEHIYEIYLALLVVVKQNILPDNDQQLYSFQPATYAKPEAAGAVVCF